MCVCAKSSNIFSVMELFFNYKEKQSESNTGNERVMETDPVHNPQKTAWGVNTAWLSDVLLFILSFSVLLLQIVSVRTHLIHGFCFLSLTHTHVSSYLPLMFHCHDPEPRSPERTISRQRKINMSVHFILLHVHKSLWWIYWVKMQQNAAKMQY